VLYQRSETLALRAALLVMGTLAPDSRSIPATWAKGCLKTVSFGSCWGIGEEKQAEPSLAQVSVRYLA
jgi:hypothetical protein